MFVLMLCNARHIHSELRHLFGYAPMVALCGVVSSAIILFDAK